MMNTMTLTAKSQCTFNKQLLAHIGAKPGDTLQVRKMPDGTLSIQTAAYTKPVSLMDMHGIIKTDLHFTEEEISQAIIDGYVSSGMSGLEYKA
jgi:alpha-D-ribose 1-methylphosphonate 5-triphosphate synthase subunit PhnH